MYLPVQGTQVQSLVGELGSHMLQGNEARKPQLEGGYTATWDVFLPQPQSSCALEPRPTAREACTATDPAQSQNHNHQQQKLSP